MDRTALDQIEAIDRSNAFEWGFWKAAQDAGLTEEAYQEMRKLAEESVRPITVKPSVGVVTSKPYTPSLGAAIVGAATAPLRAIPKVIDMTADAMMGNPVANAERARDIADRKLQAVQTGLGNAMDRGASPAVEDALRARMQAARKEYGNVRETPPTVTQRAYRAITQGLSGLMSMPKTDVDDTAVEKANRQEAPANPDFKQQLQKAQK